jgi:hypothetical protein
MVRKCTFNKNVKEVDITFRIAYGLYLQNLLLDEPNLNEVISDLRTDRVTD